MKKKVINTFATFGQHFESLDILSAGASSAPPAGAQEEKGNFLEV